MQHSNILLTDSVFLPICEMYLCWIWFGNTSLSQLKSLTCFTKILPIKNLNSSLRCSLSVELGRNSVTGGILWTGDSLDCAGVSACIRFFKAITLKKWWSLFALALEGCLALFFMSKLSPTMIYPRGQDSAFDSVSPFSNSRTGLEVCLN